MTPTEATNRITECVLQRTSPTWWASHGGYFVGLVAETMAAIDSTTIEPCDRLVRIPISAEQMNAEHVTVKADDEVDCE